MENLMSYVGGNEDFEVVVSKSTMIDIFEETFKKELGVELNEEEHFYIDFDDESGTMYCVVNQENYDIENISDEICSKFAHMDEWFLLAESVLRKFFKTAPKQHISAVESPAGNILINAFSV